MKGKKFRRINMNRYLPPHVPGAALQMREKLRLIICNAHKQGMTIMEIARVMGFKKATFVYEVLRKAHLINVLRPGKPRKITGIEPHFINIFYAKDLSPRKWCNIWGFSLEEVAHAISVSPSGSEGRITEIHRAFHRDFPDEYFKLHPTSPLNNLPVLRLQQGLLPATTALEIEIKYDNITEKYIASTDIDEVVGYGNSWVSASNDIEKVWWIFKSIKRLKNVLDEIECTNNK
jgi:hypothetical protein